MQKWEYLVLRLDTVPSSGVLMPHYVNNQEVADWVRSKSPLYAFLDELGEEGWELVLSYPDLKSLVFKRQKR